jgi:hypothetical protein
MTSGPYQSSLLRFAIAQYRQGMTRHRIALRTARSTVVMGAAVTLLPPVYAVVKASQAASQRASQWMQRRFKAVLKQVQLPGRKSKTARLFDFTDFGSSFLAAADSSDLMAQDLAAQLDSIAESMMVQTLVFVRSQLSSSQVDRLLIAQFEPERITGVASDLATRSLVLVKGHTLVWHGLNAAQQLQLQKKIAMLLTGENVAYAQALPFQPGLAVSYQVRSLTRTVRSFWVDLLRLMIWLQRGPSTGIVFQLPGFYQQPGFQLLEGAAQLPARSPAPLLARFLGRSSNLAKATFTFLLQFRKVRLCSAATLQTPDVKTLSGISVLANRTMAGMLAERSNRSISAAPAKVSNSEDNCNDINCLDAAVITVSYIEHPLETLLKWVDRLLLRLEKHWQRLKQWLLQLNSNSGAKK